MSLHLPQVSILIPVFNRNKYIAQCIQSALDQSFTSYEIVVVDNASDDGTWDICQQFAVSDPRVRVFRNEKNIGPVRNWIRCSQEARGEYSKILFSDDLLEPDCIASMLQPFKNPDVGLVFCAARIGESKEKSVIFYLAKSDSLINQKRYLSLLLHNQAPVSPGAVLLRTKDLIKNLYSSFPTATPRPFKNHGAGPDVMISLLTALAYPRVAYISNPLVFFRAHPESFSVSNVNSEITKGYTSAISYYLRYKESWFLWIHYLARSWITNVRQRRCWISPRLFLRKNEGVGSLTEILAGLVVIACHIVSKIAGRICLWCF